MLKLFFLSFIFIISLLPLSSILISDCQVISSPGSYVLSSNTTISENCFFVETNDVSINCNNNSIIGTGNGTAFTYRNISNANQIFDNISIDQCEIFNFSILANYKNSDLFSNLTISNSNLNNTGGIIDSSDFFDYFSLENVSVGKINISILNCDSDLADSLFYNNVIDGGNLTKNIDSSYCVSIIEDLDCDGNELSPSGTIKFNSIIGIPFKEISLNNCIINNSSIYKNMGAFSSILLPNITINNTKFENISNITIMDTNIFISNSSLTNINSFFIEGDNLSMVNSYFDMVFVNDGQSLEFITYINLNNSNISNSNISFSRMGTTYINNIILDNISESNFNIFDCFGGSPDSFIVNNSNFNKITGTLFNIKCSDPFFFQNSIFYNIYGDAIYGPFISLIIDNAEFSNLTFVNVTSDAIDIRSQSLENIIFKENYFQNISGSDINILYLGGGFVRNNLFYNNTFSSINGVTLPSVIDFNYFNFSGYGNSYLNYSGNLSSICFDSPDNRNCDFLPTIGIEKNFFNPSENNNIQTESTASLFPYNSIATILILIFLFFIIN